MYTHGRGSGGARGMLRAAVLLAASVIPPVASAQVVHFPRDETGAVFALSGSSLPVGDRREGAYGVGVGMAVKGIFGLTASIATAPEIEQTAFGVGAEVHPLGQMMAVGPFFLAGITQGTSLQDLLLLGGGVSAAVAFEKGLRTFFQASVAAGTPLGDDHGSEFLGGLEIGLQLPVHERVELAIVPEVSFSDEVQPGWGVSLVVAITSKPEDPNKPSDSPW